MNVRKLALAVMATLTVVFLASASPAANKLLGPEKIPSPEPQDACAEACDPACGAAPVCSAPCGPCWQVYAEYLFLRPRNEGLEYAVPMNGPITEGSTPVQVGRTGFAESVRRLGLPLRRRHGLRRVQQPVGHLHPL